MASAAQATPYSDEARTRLRAIHDRMTGGDIAGATEMAQHALEGGIEHPMVLSLAAGALEEAGEPDRALSLLARAVALAPQGFGIINAYGLCLQRLDRHEEAEAQFTAALVLAPDFAPALSNRGAARMAMARLNEAGTDFQAALVHDPANIVALNGLAALARRRNDNATARTYAEAALAIAPGLPSAELTMAEVDLALGNAQAASSRIAHILDSPALDPRDHALAEGLDGDAHDLAGRHEDAWAAWTRSGQRYRALHASEFEAAPKPQRLLTELTAILREQQDAIITSGEAGPPSHHVFLIGFPRSGTTLIEQVLEQHPDIVTLAEKECLIDSVSRTLGDADRFRSFMTLSSSALAPMRKAYWSQVARHGINPRARVFVDKHPFHSFKLPLIARLFPEATILFAQRDPRDTVLSCFRRRFQINGPTFQFLGVDTTVALYDATMEFIRATGSRMPLSFERLRLEDMIADFDGQARGLCDRLGVDWTDELHDFARGAAGRGVFTPSSSQIARGLNADGVGKWRDYEMQLAPYLPVLEPWLTRFGYGR